MRNPKQYQFLLPTASERRSAFGFASGVKSAVGSGAPKPDTDYTVSRIDDNTLKLVYKKEFLQANEHGAHTLNPEIVLWSKDGRKFSESFTFKIRANSPPPALEYRASVKTKDADGRQYYVLCFAVKDMDKTVSTGLLHKDIAALSVTAPGGGKTRVALTVSEGGFDVGTSNGFLLPIANVNKLEAGETDTGSPDEIPTGNWILYVKTGVEVGGGTQEYAFQLLDGKGLSGAERKASTATNKLPPVRLYYGTTLIPASDEAHAYPITAGSSASVHIEAQVQNDVAITGTVEKKVAASNWLKISDVSGTTTAAVSLPVFNNAENETLYKISLTAKRIGYNDSELTSFFVKLTRELFVYFSVECGNECGSLKGSYGTEQKTARVNAPETFIVLPNSSILFTAESATGYEVESWSLNGSPVNGTNATYQISNIIETGIVGVTFKKTSYSITYHLNGGTDSTSPAASYNVETPTITLPTPRKIGHTFGGWYGDSSFTGQPVGQIVTGSTGNKEFWAKWEAHTGTSYKVEHYKQNAEDNGYVKAETENMTGTTGAYTQAQAKIYQGFTAQTITQVKIEADGSTVVQIKYDRNIITLALNLDGGSTTTTLIDGEAGKKLLKGKFGAAVRLEAPTKPTYRFTGWTPNLPTSFPASSPTETYTASWIDGYIITLAGDERTNIPVGSFIKTIAENWSGAKNDAIQKVSLKPDWQGGDYAVYEWRLDSGTGELLTDNYPINNNLTVYAVTNYTKFKIEGTKLTEYTGAKPKGKIIIPESVTVIGLGAFERCTDLTQVDFPTHLTDIEGKINYPGAFDYCRSLNNLNFSACNKLTKIGCYAFRGCTALTQVDFPESLTTIEFDTFFKCSGLQKLTFPNKLETIGWGSFTDCTSLKEVHFPETLSILFGFNGCINLRNIDLSHCTKLPRIGSLTFEDCTHLQQISLPDSITEIDRQAFNRCYALTQIRFSNKLTKIGLNVFANCTSLASVFFSDTQGWAVYNDKEYQQKHTDISPSDLQNAATAVQYLRSTYKEKYWKKD